MEEVVASQPSSRRGSRRGKKTSTPPAAIVDESTTASSVVSTMEEMDDGEVIYEVKTSATDKMTESRTEAITAENGRYGRSICVCLCVFVSDYMKVNERERVF